MKTFYRPCLTKIRILLSWKTNLSSIYINLSLNPDQLLNWSKHRQSWLIKYTDLYRVYRLCKNCRVCLICIYSQIQLPSIYIYIMVCKGANDIPDLYSKSRRIPMVCVTLVVFSLIFLKIFFNFKNETEQVCYFHLKIKNLSGENCWKRLILKSVASIQIQKVVTFNSESI